MHRRFPRAVAATVLICFSLLGAAPPADAGGAPAAKKKTTRATAGKSTARKAAAAKTTRKRTVAPRRYSGSKSRRARLARVRAARAKAQWLEASTPRYKTDATGAVVPDVRAAAAIIYDPETGEVLWEENAQAQRSIASITKVMTAAVILESEPDLTRVVRIDRADVYRSNHTFLRAGEQISLEDLLHLTLVASDNAAARALARTWPGGYEAFIDRMNEKAEELGLDHTSYADPSGLDADNVSSAYDMARLIAYASGDERVSGVMRKAHHTVRTHRRSFNINNTNQLVLRGDVDVRGGKTGFISRAGYCLASLLRLPQTGQQVAVVVLGARSNAGRFWETRHLFNWLSTRAPSLFVPNQAEPQNLQLQ